MRLDGRVAVVTGGTKGLGRRIVEAFAREGCKVVAAGRDKSVGADLVESGGDIVVHEADVRDPESVDELMRAAAEYFGHLDVVVANAGVSRPGPAALLDPADFADTMATNLGGVFHCTRSAVPYLERSEFGGRIVNLSSALATRVAPGASAYAATKAAVEMFTRVTAVELAPKGITVNALCPGLIDEGMTRSIKDNERVWALYEPKLAMGRLGSPDEVTAAALFLAGAESSYVNGHVLEVNGGLNW
ncbi:SDR family NAD(P)-dependent oxidoreductase [Streptomyces cupreus]|uniref:SDR family oxidoreductase n=1 Tax=Streptomyces cupreus TaxID=2759956 RepID=A0A7X1MCJ6_9ACTN|nr:SDR family NAD(P)-dependent oxidoreductase [Streptomyces cupreus]MBC2906277.1 SDR family oxidoreductase [Streptomyces cupreus]